MLKIRRDSTVSELDERLKEAKLTNKKFRKQLLQKDSELQVDFSIHQTSKRYISKNYFADIINLDSYVRQFVAELSLFLQVLRQIWNWLLMFGDKMKFYSEN